MKSAPLLLVALVVAGCAGGHLYPVQGPLAAKKPPPIYRLKMEYGDAMSATLGNGQGCHGTWLDIVKEDPSVREMSAEWDLVYGKGFFEANVLDHPGIARATLKCADDATLQVEFNSTQGVGKDKDGDVFKLTF